MNRVDYKLFESLMPQAPSWPAISEPWIDEGRWLKQQVECTVMEEMQACILWPYRRTTTETPYLLGRRWASMARRYGKYKLVCVRHNAHYTAWQFAFGLFPLDSVVEPSCGLRLCVNPLHLVLRQASTARKRKHQWIYVFN